MQQRRLKEKAKSEKDNGPNNIYPPFSKENIDPPGVEEEMSQKPVYIHEKYQGSGKLEGKVALVTGGDSGIGRAVCLHFALEGADICFTYLESEEEDAFYTAKLIQNTGRNCCQIPVDFSKNFDSSELVAKAKKQLGKIDILVNNAAFQNHVGSVEELSFEQFKKTFEVNVFAQFKLTKEILPEIEKGGCIINTGSILGYVGNSNLIDYSATKASVHSMTKSFAKELADRKIRVNSVAPGPVWTPLNPAERKQKDIESFGSDTAFGRPAQPAEIAPAFVFLASEITGGYITGETINIFGGSSGAN